MKTCGHCKVEKPVIEFHKSRCQPDGLAGNCKPCCAEWKRAYRARNAEVLREYDRERAKSPEREQQLLVNRKRYRQRHAEKSKVHGIFSYAVRLGIVKPQPCLVCGEKAHGHHPDYDRPLDVVWLCPQHHKDAHAAVHIELKT